MVYIGCDHAGYEIKNDIAKYLEENNIEYKDLGCNGEKVDYPVIAEKVCTGVLEDVENNKGILICGTGIGMSIAANKIKGIRAAHCTDEYSSKYTRLHNNANVLCMGARITGSGLALEIAEVFLNTEFEGGRHQRRIDLIDRLEEI
ncbi:MAG: ribose 5-phosphate isomerase B [Oscillospiraceae bacterium]|nr:ribose 5-phosphate isomerase B [Oscillospiraceae bacterium]MDD6084803.1 ribose 5-phosphate isomerase B [Oscillospiraceae bacterium]MDY3258492.1 ribose 5-phosphate isomerase B [Ruminococcus callidus]